MLKTVALIAGSTLMAGSVLGADGVSSGAAPRTEVVVGDPNDAYGTTSLTAHVVASFGFQPYAPTTQMTAAQGFDRFINTSLGVAVAGLMLPNGAQVERIEARACDTSATQQVNLTVGICPTQGSPCVAVGQVVTGVAAVPGCNTFSTILATPIIVDNQGALLYLQFTTGTTATTTFSAAKVYYRLRTSPAPAVASFTDVPTTHGQFRFVEALAAAGITGGCGGGNFCPDSPLTRGQMAVFLASALGLHFPN